MELVLSHHQNELSILKRKVKFLGKVRSIQQSIHFRVDESSDDDDIDDDDDQSSSTYATTDDQQNKESSISPVPIPIQNHHYQNPPTVEAIIKSRNC